MKFHISEYAELLYTLVISFMKMSRN